MVSQCEEFWYTNVPDEEASSLGFCGGGTYRELHVYVNGLLAGIAYPHLVIYTGEAARSEEGGEGSGGEGGGEEGQTSLSASHTEFLF